MSIAPLTPTLSHTGEREVAGIILAVIIFLLVVPDLARAQNKNSNPLFAFVIGSWIQTPVGTYLRHEKKWISGDDFYAPFQPEDLVTLFDLGGKVAEVRDIAPRRPDPSGVPKGWEAQLEKWTPSPGSEPYALAVKGSWPASKNIPQPISLQDPQAVQFMRDALASHGLQVADPRMTQALRLNLTPDGSDILLFLSACSDPKAFQDNVAGARYTLALLVHHTLHGDHVFTLESQTSFKPAQRTVAEHEHFYGIADQDRFVTFVDLNGDGQNELVLYVAHDKAFTVDVFTFDGKTPRKVISVDKLTDL